MQTKCLTKIVKSQRFLYNHNKYFVRPLDNWGKNQLLWLIWQLFLVDCFKFVFWVEKGGREKGRHGVIMWFHTPSCSTETRISVQIVMQT